MEKGTVLGMRNRGVLLTLGVLVLVVLLAGGSLASSYNRLVVLNEGIDGQWAQVENQFQRRLDLFPNLVETVKGYAAHEREVFTQIAESRARLAGGGLSTEQRVAEANRLESALARLLVIVEQYPQLKADASFIRLQDELAGTENRIAVERMRYNELVRNYNQVVKTFPTVLVARFLGFSERAYFQAESKETPRVKF